LFFASTLTPRRRFAGKVGGVNSVHCPVVGSSFAALPMFHSEDHTLSVLSMAMP
jgi:hypothetical protein